MERGPGYLPGDILLVGNAGFRGSRSSKKKKKKKKFPKGGHSKWNHRSIGDREADLSIMRHRLSNQRKASSVRNERNLSLFVFEMDEKREVVERRRSVSVIHGQWAEYLFGSPFHRVPRSFRFMIDLSTSCFHPPRKQNRNFLYSLSLF